MLRNTQFLLLAATCLATAPATAGETTPVEATQTQVGDLSVTTYSVPTTSGFRVVTIAQLAANQPDGAKRAGAQPAVMRFVTTLLPGQDTIVSVPQAEGMPVEALRITRIGDRLSIDRVGAMTE